MTDSETKRIASAAAKEALQEFMLMLGVDISTPSGIIDLQKDFHHVRNARTMVDEARDALRRKLFDVLTGGAVTGLVGALALYFTHGPKP
jgi:hypothetical protein